tara:strand:- start:5 stop:388 length:384 start_codon:yes stop_codon:yes gene_type:complete
MKNFSKKPSHIEQALMRMHKGQWFIWTDPKNKIYANLRLAEKMGVDGDLIDNPHSLPSESDVTTILTQLQSEWDTENATYRLNRKKSYAKIEEQLDLLYKDMTAGKLDATGEWHKATKKVKDDNPKE